MKSSKTATVKIVLGVFTAVALIIAFACEQKEVLEVEPMNQDEALSLIKDAAPKMLDEDEQIFFIVESMPEFPGGEFALRRFIAYNIDYPESARKEGVQGRVYVTFVVDKEGNVANAKIARGADPLLDREALRVVNSLPEWNPGTQRGEPVNVSYTVPINFALQ